MSDLLRECSPGRPEVLVTPKVMDIFVKAGVTTFEWTPVGMLPSFDPELPPIAERVPDERRVG